MTPLECINEHCQIPLIEDQHSVGPRCNPCWRYWRKKGEERPEKMVDKQYARYRIKLARLS